jgi:hypothetical protein
MKTVFLFLCAAFILAAPVRLAAHLFKASNGTWLRSFGVLFVTALLVGLCVNYFPPAWASKGLFRGVVTVVVGAVVSQLLLGIKTWQALLLALGIAALYTLGEGELGSADMSLSVGASL